MWNVKMRVDVPLEQRLSKAMEAIGQHDWPFLRYLIEQAPIVCKMQVPETGATLLHVAAREGHHAMVNGVLNAYGTAVGAQDAGGQTALHYAAQQGHTVIAKMLVKAGANVNAQDCRGKTALTEAVSSGKDDTAVLLIKYGADPLQRATYGESPIEMAAMHDMVTVLEEMVNGGNVDINIRLGEDRPTLLHYAISGGARDAVNYLLSKGADVDVRDSDGNTPLICACSPGNELIIKALLEHEADTSIANEEGNTPLHMAAYHCWDGVGTLLIACGADLNAIDAFGQTPVQVALKTASIKKKFPLN